MNAQTIGSILDLVKVIGGGLIALGVLRITNDQLNVIITQVSAILIAVLGLVVIVGPLVRSAYLRTRLGSIKLASGNLKPGETILLRDQAEADKLPNNVQAVSSATKPAA